MRHLYTTIVAIVATVTAAWATPPTGYYDNMNGKTGAELKTATYRIINPHMTPESYSSYYSALSSTFMKTDLYPGSMRWWDMYSNITLYAPSFQGLNREHSFPKSWWGGSQSIPPYVDLNHLYPSERAANTAKSNYPLGEVASASFDNSVCKVGTPAGGQGGGASKVFEPADEYKGDFARTYFYMVTCYQELTWRYTYMTQNNTYPTLQPWAMQMLLRWSREDPVSQKELDRNEAVYRIQNNRNPFIDFPQLAEYIWGNRKGELFYVSSSPEPPAGDPELITPVNGMALDFNQVAEGNSTSSRLHLKGVDLTNNLSILISGTNKNMFTVSESSVRPELVNADDGYWLTVTYRPTMLGSHSATLVIYDYDNLGSQTTVSLIGECLPVPTLTAPVAIDPEMNGTESYTARWTVPDGEVVDYFIVTRTMNTGGTATTEELLAEQNYLTIDGFDAHDSESYSVQSVRLGYRSPMSNVIFVAHTGVQGISDALPLEVVSDGGVTRVVTAVPHEDAAIIDIAGKIVARYDLLADGTVIDLPAGIYFLTTARHPLPVKIIIR